MPAWPVIFFSRETFGCPFLSSFAALPDAEDPDERPRPPSFGPRPALLEGAVASVGLLRAMSTDYGRAAPHHSQARGGPPQRAGRGSDRRGQASGLDRLL